MWQAETSSGCEVPWIEKASPQARLPESTGRHSGENCPARECLRRDTGPEAGRPSNCPERLHSPVSSACQVTGTARGTPLVHHRGTEKGDGEKPTKSATRFHHRGTEGTEKGDTDQTSNRQEHTHGFTTETQRHRERRQPQNSNRQGRGRGEALEQGRPEPHGTCPVENTRPHVGHWGPEDTPAGAGLPDRGRASPGPGPILLLHPFPRPSPPNPDSPLPSSTLRREKIHHQGTEDPKKGEEAKTLTDHGVRHSPDFAAPQTGSLYRVLQMRGGWHEDVLPVLHVPGRRHSRCGTL